MYFLNIMSPCALIYIVIDLRLSQYSREILFLQHFDHTLVILRQLEEDYQAVIKMLQNKNFPTVL